MDEPMCGARQSAWRGDSIGGCEGGSGAATRPGERRNVGGTITHSWSKEWQGGDAKLACPGSPRAAKMKMFVALSHNNNLFNQS